MKYGDFSTKSAIFTIFHHFGGKITKKAPWLICLAIFYALKRNAKLVFPAPPRRGNVTSRSEFHSRVGKYPFAESGFPRKKWISGENVILGGNSTNLRWEFIWFRQFCGFWCFRDAKS